MLRSIGYVAAITLGVGLFCTFLGDQAPGPLQWVLVPIYALLILPGFLVAWGGVLGDDGTAISVGLLGTAISLALNCTLAGMIGWVVARYRRARSVPSCAKQADD